MLRGCVVRDCDTGIRFNAGGGVIEDTVVEGATIAFHVQFANLQLTNFLIKNLKAKGTGIFLESGSLTLLNCNVPPTQVNSVAQAATVKDDPVTCLQYAIVGVKAAPADAVVDIRTVNVAADVGDRNVRNSPAPLTRGTTPLPNTLNPLIVKAWSIDVKGKLQAGPEYNVKVLGPAAKEGAPRPLLKMLTFRPQENAFRASLEEATPTLEVSLK
jgi:hypothetical protein